MGSVDDFLAARDVLLRHRTDYDAARREFRWPQPAAFNWALDWFDRIAEGNDRPALRVIDDDGTEHTRSFREMAHRSDQVANHLRSLGLRRGDRMLVMLGNVPELWEAMLGAMKLGVVVIPATLLLSADDLRDRLERGRVRAVIAAAEVADRFAGLPGAELRIAVGGEPEGWHRFTDADGAAATFEPDGETPADDPLLLYFTSGTTSRPKLVEHTHTSYPVGHLSTMYWIGLQPGDVHLNISSPGWAKHAWSNLFAPWNAEATVLVLNHARFDADRLLGVLDRCGVTTLCAPPTVWRMLIQADLTAHRLPLRELVAAGEPLNPEIVDQVRKAWGLTVRDGFGQTETTAQIGNSPGQPVKPGSMGRPLPGYHVVLLDTEGRHAEEGELSLDLARRPAGLMRGYAGDEEKTAVAMRGGHYRTGDVASQDADGYITYVGRADDVFKASDYRISPFELESVLIEHPAVAEAAVVPSPDPVRLAVPKAFVVLVQGREPSADLACDILRFTRERLSAYKRIRRLEFADLPKTVSGKIRRVELRQHEQQHGEPRNPNEYWESDFPSLKDRP
ncbi:AMP-binding protein [Kitasatospora sp. DSM 101779]|uniref:AMP-binding protein n=1 Tax=Kitasatospora sp. DSM 101779 TaxID=2853165 RepID=UPI0021DB1654|nr:AMP-binding protein [Kitasatospora sp. DSM 101779]MCU7821666.1 AMP-binding protein [Kitasatospora sp. DSM 101779]